MMANLLFIVWSFLFKGDSISIFYSTGVKEEQLESSVLSNLETLSTSDGILVAKVAGFTYVEIIPKHLVFVIKRKILLTVRQTNDIIVHKKDHYDAFIARLLKMAGIQQSLVLETGGV